MKPLFFGVWGFPRSGSTLLVRLLSLHQEIKCCSEPFHPRRFGGAFLEEAVSAGSCGPSLRRLASSWSGLKHVCDPQSAWPFNENEGLNLSLLETLPVVIRLRRRNLLQQYVSVVVSRHIRFWVGTKSEFLERVRQANLPTLVSEDALCYIKAAEKKMLEADSVLQGRVNPYLDIYYEEMCEHLNPPSVMLNWLNHLTSQLGYAPADDRYHAQLMTAADPDAYKWADDDTYELIPGARRLDDELGSLGYGRLFQR